MSKEISTTNHTTTNNIPTEKKTSSLSNNPYPLDWTRINRRPKRKRVTADGKDPSGAETEWTFFCCEDPSCQQQQPHPPPQRKDENVQIETKSEQDDEHGMSFLKGKGLFCLHSLDCTWFQGQFIPNNASTGTSVSQSNSITMKTNVSSFGLLAVQRSDLDECLQCKDGGYREIDLTILSSSSKLHGTRNFGGTKTQRGGRRRKLKIEKLQCTGGDMLRITTPPTLNSSSRTTNDVYSEKGIMNNNENLDQTQTQVTFDAERIITGKKVESLVKRYFPNILSSSSSSTKQDCFSELLPDCAIVIGDMHLQAPTDFVYGGKRNIVAATGHDNNVTDDWLE